MKVSVRRFQGKDISNKIKWINDRDNNLYLHYDLPLEYEKTLAWFERIKDREDRYDGVIEIDGVPVGLIGLLSINKDLGKAEYYIVLGEKGYRGRGIGIQASNLLLDYAFKNLGLNKLYLYTEVDNKGAQKLFERLGFKKEGLLRHDIKNDGRLVDRFVYGILKEESTNKVLIRQGHFEPSVIVKSHMKTDNNLYIKRDDCLPFSFGGNKLRKAMYFFEDIERNQSDCVVSYGTSSSNHCRIVANMAASKELPVYIITPEEDFKETYNSRFLEAFGAKIISCPLDKVRETIDRTMEDLKEKGYRPYFIQGGGHGDLGTRAYVDAYNEIRDFERENNIYFDYIFHASGTGTTQAGLVCGSIINKDTRRIIGISIARKNPYGGEVVLESVNSYLASIKRNRVEKVRVDFIDDYVLDGYGGYNQDILDTIREVFIKDGIPLDTTYTGKAFWAMREYLKKEGIRGKNILFIHTGGGPIFFNDCQAMGKG